MPRAGDLPLRGAHLAGLWALAFAQPLFDLLARNPASYFGRNGLWDVVASSLALVFVPPLLLLALEALAALVSRRLARLLHLLFVAALVAALAFLALKQAPEPLRVLVASALGAAAAAAGGAGAGTVPSSTRGRNRSSVGSGASGRSSLTVSYRRWR